MRKVLWLIATVLAFTALSFGLSVPAASAADTPAVQATVASVTQSTSDPTKLTIDVSGVTDGQHPIAFNVKLTGAGGATLYQNEGGPFVQGTAVSKPATAPEGTSSVTLTVSYDGNDDPPVPLTNTVDLKWPTTGPTQVELKEADIVVTSPEVGKVRVENKSDWTVSVTVQGEDKLVQPGKSATFDVSGATVTVKATVSQQGVQSNTVTATVGVKQPDEPAPTTKPTPTTRPPHNGGGNGGNQPTVRPTVTPTATAKPTATTTAKPTAKPTTSAGQFPAEDNSDEVGQAQTAIVAVGVTVAVALFGLLLFFWLRPKKGAAL